MTVPTLEQGVYCNRQYNFISTNNISRFKSNDCYFVTFVRSLLLLQQIMSIKRTKCAALVFMSSIWILSQFDVKALVKALPLQEILIPKK